MFRATSCIVTVRTLLYRRHPADLQIACISRCYPNLKYSKSPSKAREPCPPPQPLPPPPPKDDRLLWGTIALLFIAGGFVVYAKGSPEIRDWITLNAPWFDDLIAILYQENMTYGEFAVTFVEDTKRFIKNMTGENKPKKCSIDGGPVLTLDVPDEQKDGKVCIKEPPPVVTRDICEIEKCMVELGESALSNYNKAKEACASYNKLVEDTMTTFSFRGMKALHKAMCARKDAVREALNNASGCVNKLDEMVRYLDCGVQASKEQIANSKLISVDFHQKFKAAFMEYQWENDKSLVMDRRWQIVEDIVDKYTSENEAIFPELKYKSKKPYVSGDLDIVLYNSYRYLHSLNTELKAVSEAMTERVNRAMENLPQSEKKVKAREANLEAVLKQKRAEIDNDFKKREDEQKARNDKHLKDSLKKQLDRHEESLAAKLRAREEEVTQKFDSMVAEKVAAEQRIFAIQIEEMSMKLKIVEEKLNVRLKAERETRRSQELWSAGASLLEATKKGDPFVKVDKELKAIEKASGDGDQLVLTVLKSIPESVRETGIVPESVLRERFRIMEKTARNVALVEQNGAAMPVYMLSWLQGLLLFMKVSGIPQGEFEKPPLEPPKHLDTFDLLQRARFWIDRGNLAAAIRYVNSLEGASRAAAAKWYEAARAHLEVRQAAEAVLAHAAALGLQYI